SIKSTVNSIVDFIEAMDQGINPDISFPVEDASSTLTFASGVWDNAQTYRGTFNITDANIELQDIDVRISNGLDLAGNVMEVFDDLDVFDIDTENPIISIDPYATSISSPELTGSISDPAATISINVASVDYAATNNGDGTWTLAAGTIASLADDTYEVVATATDPAGNIGLDESTNELIISQTTITVAATNITATSFQANWSEALDVQTYQIDVSESNDFATLVDGFDNAETTETSINVTGLDFTQNYFYRVRVVNTASEVSEDSNVTGTKTTIDAVTLADSLALDQIYEAVNPQGINWETERLRRWDGIVLDAGKTRVATVDLSGTSSAGVMPNPFTGDALTNGGLANMTAMNIADNQISGLIDFSATSVDNLNVSGNNLTFGDLEPLLGITTLDYSNQSNIQFLEDNGGEPIKVPHLDDPDLEVITDGTQNVYTWYRNDVLLETSEDFNVIGTTLVINDIDFESMGVFRAEVSSDLVTGLTINVDAQEILATADVTMRLTDSNDALITSETFQAALLENIRLESGYDTLERANDVGSSFVFEDVVLGDYLCGIDPDNDEDLIPTYFGDAFQWEEAEVVTLRADVTLNIVMEDVPPPLTEVDGEGTLDLVIEEDFPEDGARVEARRRAARRKCGLRKRRRGGRTDQEDIFDLIAYGETDDNGEFQFGFLPEGVYRFFVEYPGIPIDDAASVEFTVEEAGIGDTDFKLQAFASPDGIEVT
ncbi:MAG: Ig-like domain-containing protein, partial [Bacteroidota bacterium]